MMLSIPNREVEGLELADSVQYMNTLFDMSEQLSSELLRSCNLLEKKRLPHLALELENSYLKLKQQQNLFAKAILGFL